MPAPQPTTGDVVQIAPFLNLAKGNKWVYDNLSFGGIFTLSCDPFSGQSDGKEWLQITVDPKRILPDMVMEVAGVSERQYTWIKATWSGTPLTWQKDVSLPPRWKVGEMVTATSVEQAPASSRPAQVSLKLLNMPHTVPPDPNWPHLPLPPGTRVIEIDLFLVDTGFQGFFIRNTLMFAEKVGLVRVFGEDYGRSNRLNLKKWSGMH